MTAATNRAIRKRIRLRPFSLRRIDSSP
jgi:hypothetical protein